jgi:Protein of unknown function (DUF1254)
LPGFPQVHWSTPERESQPRQHLFVSVNTECNTKVYGSVGRVTFWPASAFAFASWVVPLDHRLRHAGPDRGERGKFLLIPPGYGDELPDSGFHVGHSSTNRVLLLGRSFMQDDDPKPTADLIKSTLKLYPYIPGRYGTSIATLLEGKVQPGAPSAPPETKFIEASDKAFNTIPPATWDSLSC